MDPTTELLKQGVLGLVAAIFLWLYLREVGRHDVTRKEKDAQAEARRVDAVNTVDKITGPLDTISQYSKLTYDKLLASKKAR